MKILLAIAFIALSGPVCSTAQTIRLFAGNMSTDVSCVGYPSDGGPALSGILCKPDAIAVTNTGIIYFSENNFTTLRKINASGIISTPALSGASISNFYDIAADNSGNLYVIGASSVVFKITPAGVVSIYAGSASSTSGSTGNGGPATAATLAFPSCIAVDGAGNLYIAESGITTSQIRKVNTSGVINAFAGTGSQGYYGEGIAATGALFNGITSMTFDASGNLYVHDAGRIRKILVSGIINTISGNGTAGYSGDGGPASAAVYKNVQKIAAAGNDIYVCDNGNYRIRKITNGGAGNVTTVAGTGVYGYSGDGAPAHYADIQLFANDMGVNPVTGKVFLSQRGMNNMRAIDAPSGIDETSTATGNVTVQPNPATGNFSVNLIVDASNATVKVVDILGRCISQKVVAINPFESATASFGGIPTGVYSVIVTTCKSVYTQKVVVN